MHSNRLLRRTVYCLGLFSCCLAAADQAPAANQEPQLTGLSDLQAQPSWLEAIRDLPILRLFVPIGSPYPALPDPLALLAAQRPATCSVRPLAPVDDPDAMVFETSADGPRIDLRGLTPATSRALARFQKVVRSAGGALWLTSAYRPPAYQQHLQSVWDKWNELRDNQQPECQEMKTAVAVEFAGHQLLATQRPASFSDHTRGTGFDAAVTLKVVTRQRRRRFSIDRLARLAGIHRPDIAHDPVHFRLIARASRS